ncbi:MAG: alcohol dehydrogenase catalytic domain-containing protein [Vampirovibrionales bacterium]
MMTRPSHNANALQSPWDSMNTVDTVATLDPTTETPALAWQLQVNNDTQRFDVLPQATPPSLAGREGLLMATLACGLCGTDVEKLQQRKVPQGSVLGHEVVGRITALSSPHPPLTCWQEPLQVGDRIVVAHHVPCGDCHYCQHHSPSMCQTFKQTNLLPGGFASQVFVSSAHIAHTTFKVPSHISHREAACVEPLACVLRAVRRCNQATQHPVLTGQAVHNNVTQQHIECPSPQRVAVIGLGFIGLLASQVFKQQGDVVLGYDLKASRLFLAQQGAMVDVATQATQPIEHQHAQAEPFLAKHPNGDALGVDVVCLTVVNPHTVAQALRLVRDGGVVLVLAGNATQATTVDLTPLYYREITVVTSYSPALQDLEQAARWVFERRLSLTPLLTHPTPLHEANQGLEAYLQGEAIKTILEF